MLQYVIGFGLPALFRAVMPWEDVHEDELCDGIKIYKVVPQSYARGDYFEFIFCTGQRAKVEYLILGENNEVQGYFVTEKEVPSYTRVYGRVYATPDMEPGKRYKLVVINLVTKARDETPYYEVPKFNPFVEIGMIIVCLAIGIGIGAIITKPCDTIKGTGTVKYINLEGGFYGIITDNGKKIYPINLPNEYKTDGLRVKFKARILRNVTTQMWGTPVEIIEIRTTNYRLIGHPICKDIESSSY